MQPGALRRPSGNQRIDDRLLHPLHCGFEQRVKRRAAQTLDLRRLGAVNGPVAVIRAGIGGGKGDEDVAGPIALNRPRRPSPTEARRARRFSCSAVKGASVAMTMMIEPRCSWLRPSAIATSFGSQSVATVPNRCCGGEVSFATLRGCSVTSRATGMPATRNCRAEP